MQNQRYDMEPTEPLVSIGVPVYNGGRTIRQALASLLNQSYRNLELIISDNASTDDTREICLSFASRDERIRYHRQPRNLGPIANFNVVLAAASGEYFMWAAADDEWEPTFIEENLRALLEDSSTVASISLVQMLRDGAPFPVRSGTAPLLEEPAENIKRFLRSPGLNDRFYALFRTSVLRESISDRFYWGYDVTAMVRVLERGKFAEAPKVLMRRNLRGESSNPLYVIRRYNRTMFGRVLPLGPAALELLRDPAFPRTAGTLSALAIWVGRSFLEYVYLHLKMLIGLALGMHRNSLSQWFLFQSFQRPEN